MRSTSRRILGAEILGQASPAGAQEVRLEIPEDPQGLLVACPQGDLFFAYMHDEVAPFLLYAQFACATCTPAHRWE